MNTTQFVIDLSGRFYRETIDRSPIDPGDALLKALSASAPAVKLKNLFVMPGCGPVSVSIESGGRQYWTVPLTEIVFRSTFKAVTTESGPEMYPSFQKEGPNLSIAWNIAEAIAGKETPAIRFVAQVVLSGGLYYVEKQHIYALSTDGNAYIMPMANVYNSGEICAGDYNSQSETAAGAVEKAIAQFRSAPYNRDLYESAYESLTAKFFHFKPLQTGFQTLPIVGDWWRLCEKVSVPLLKYVIL